MIDVGAKTVCFACDECGIHEQVERRIQVARELGENLQYEFNMMEHDKFLMQELYSRPCNMFNVGAMMPWMDYTPRTLEQVELLSNGWKIESVGKNE